MTGKPILVGDGIENPGNALTMLHAAEMYGAGCYFHDTKGLCEAESMRDVFSISGASFPAVNGSEVQASHSRIIACDNLPGAAEIYGFHPKAAPALLLGNERRGLSHEFRSLATDAVQIPMLSKRINCLNVAAASAVALHYLCRIRAGPMAKRRDPASRRPELLLIGADNHIELGSAIRSAAAFGWQRALLEDRQQVWFGCDRVRRSQGRAAARRGRNAIKLISCLPATDYRFPEVTVITTSRTGLALHRANLARGQSQLIVIPDESQICIAKETWTRLGQNIQFVHLDLPVEKFTYHYRLAATVAMAEISRQVGGRRIQERKRKPRAPVYSRALELDAETAGETVYLEDLLDY